MSYDNSNQRRIGEAARGYPSATTAIEDRLRGMRETAGRLSPLTLTVQRSSLVGETSAARVLFQIGGPATEANLEQAISEAFDNHVRVMPHSGHWPNKDNPGLLCAFLALNAPSMPYEAANTAKMTEVTKQNVFRDASDNIWRAVGEGDGRMLVQDTEDDLASLLNTRGSGSIATASVEVSLGEAYQAGDGVLWYDTSDERLRTGIAVSDRYVYAFDSASTDKHEMMEVHPTEVLVVDEGNRQVQASVDLKITGVEQADGSVTPGPGQPGVVPNTMNALNILNGQGLDRSGLTAQNMIDRHLAYMRVLYASNGEYFQRLQDLMQGAFKDSLALNPNAGFGAPGATITQASVDTTAEEATWAGLSAADKQTALAALQASKA